MRRRFLCALFCIGSFGIAQAADVAISLRYLRPKGKSHAAIFLFTGEGKLVRQLTEPNDSQDVNPAFAPDGKSLIFTSENDKTQKRVLVSLKLADKSVQVLKGEPPAWYKERVIAKPFEDDHNAPVPAKADASDPNTFPTADGAYTIVLKPRKPAPGETVDEFDKDGFLKIGKKAELIPFTKMPGFMSFWMLHTADGSPYPPITQPRIALLDGVHNSTDGTQFYALDLAARRIVQLSPNGGEVYPWPGHPGFFADSASRYEELGDGRTVNCNYLDLYDAKLRRTRFGHSLGRFHGGSILVPGEKPFNIVDTEFLEKPAQ
jgi:hypothetical protein